VIFILILIVCPNYSAEAENREQYVFRSTYVYENRGSDAYVVTQDDATIIMFANNEWQTVTTRNASHPTRMQYKDEDGNSLVVMDLPQTIPPQSRIIFSIEYVITSEDRPKPNVVADEAGQLSDIPQEIIDEYCVETETYRQNEDVRSFARSLAAGEKTVLGVVTHMIDWILKNITYGNFEVPKYPEETLADMIGDCDDQAILLISMLRSLGIPSFLQVGVVFSDQIESEKASWGGHLTIRQQSVGWHGWAMVYIPPWGWLPVDLTLSGSNDPIELIQKAPEYESYVVKAFNISRQAYVGDSRESREMIMSSSIYITTTDSLIKETTDMGLVKLVYILTGVLAGGAFVVLVIVFHWRKRILEHSH